MAPRQRSSDDESKKARIDYFKRRFPGFKKKAKELSVLCDNSVAFICYTPDDDKVHVWPENRQELQQIVSKFNRQSHEKRIKHACDLYDFPQLDGLSAEELRNHLSVIRAQLFGIRQKKAELMLKKINEGSSDEQRGSGSSRVSEDTQLGFGQTLVSNSGCASSRDLVTVRGTEADSQLGFHGGDFIPVSEETQLGFDESVYNLGCGSSEDVVGVSGMEADSQLGFHGGDYVPASEPMAVVTYNPSGFCGNDCIWDSSQLELEVFGFETQTLPIV